MEQERKDRLMEKLAVLYDQFGRPFPSSGDSKPSGGPPKGKAGKAGGWAKTVGKEAADPKLLGKALRDVLGKGALAGGALLAAKYLKPKKTLIQKLIGEGTVGRKALMFGGGAAGIAGGLKGMEALSESITNPMKKKKYFNNMMEENPALKREPQRDVTRIFRTLYKFNPTMASDPLVAGSFLKRSLQFKEEGIQPIDVKTLVEISRGLKDSKGKDSLLRGAFAGTGAELLSFAG